VNDIYKEVETRLSAKALASWQTKRVERKDQLIAWAYSCVRHPGNIHLWPNDELTEEQGLDLAVKFLDDKLNEENHHADIRPLQ
jgi:hypothetical protein